MFVCRFMINKKFRPHVYWISQYFKKEHKDLRVRKIQALKPKAAQLSQVDSNDRKAQGKQVCNTKIIKANMPKFFALQSFCPT